MCGIGSHVRFGSVANDISMVLGAPGALKGAFINFLHLLHFYHPFDSHGAQGHAFAAEAVGGGAWAERGGSESRAATVRPRLGGGIHPPQRRKPRPPTPITVGGLCGTVCPLRQRELIKKVIPL